MKQEPLRSQQRGKSPAKWKALHGSRIEPLLILSVPNNFRTSSPPPPPGALPCGQFQLLLLCTNHPKAWPLKTTISLGSRSLSVRNQKAQGRRALCAPWCLKPPLERGKGWRDSQTSHWNHRGACPLPRPAAGWAHQACWPAPRPRPFQGTASASSQHSGRVPTASVPRWETCCLL